MGSRTYTTVCLLAATSSEREATAFSTPFIMLVIGPCSFVQCPACPHMCAVRTDFTSFTQLFAWGVYVVHINGQ